MNYAMPEMLASLIARLPPEIAAIKIGVELEFYTKASVSPSAVKEICIAHGIHLLFIEQESGEGQYEACLPPYIDMMQLVQHIVMLKQLLSLHLAADFAAKPFANQPGSSMHFHLSLHDKEGDNLFASNTIDSNPLLQCALGGLCQTMAEAMVFFAPTEACYLRYQGMHHTPSKICWGVNNRTAALRLPEVEPTMRRIEHRVPSSMADPGAVLVAIIAGIICGMEHDLQSPVRLFGNAFDTQYNLPLLPYTLAASKEAFSKGTHLLPLFTQLQYDTSN